MKVIFWSDLPNEVVSQRDSTLNFLQFVDVSQSWDTILTTAKREIWYLALQLVLQCGPPADVENAVLSSINGTRQFKSMIKYECDPGYVMVGRPELMCDVDEKWNGPPPRCEPVYCEEPLSIRNGGFSLSTNSTRYGFPLIELKLWWYSRNDGGLKRGDRRLLVCFNDALPLRKHLLLTSPTSSSKLLSLPSPFMSLTIR